MRLYFPLAKSLLRAAQEWEGVKVESEIHICLRALLTNLKLPKKVEAKEEYLLKLQVTVDLRWVPLRLHLLPAPIKGLESL